MDALIDFGCSVVDTSMVGGGFGDVVCGVNRHNFILEVKDSSQPPSKRHLTPAEKDFHREWKGRIHLVETTDQAIAIAQHYCKA